MLGLACAVNLDRLPCCREYRWQWFSKYCLAARVSSALIGRYQLPQSFREEVRFLIISTRALFHCYFSGSKENQGNQWWHWRNQSRLWAAGNFLSSVWRAAAEVAEQVNSDLKYFLRIFKWCDVLENLMTGHCPGTRVESSTGGATIIEVSWAVSKEQKSSCRLVARVFPLWIRCKLLVGSKPCFQLQPRATFMPQV